MSKTNWLTPKTCTGQSMHERGENDGMKRRWYKVIRIYRVYTAGKKDALKAVHEGDDDYLVMEFAKEDAGKGLLAMILKQVLG